MPDPTPYPETSGDGDDVGSPAGTPRWVKLFAIVALVVILLFVILLIASGGDHGPSRH